MAKKDFTSQAYKDRKGMVYVDASDAVSGLYKFANFTRAECKSVAKKYAQEATDYMKKNAPWKDRSAADHAARHPGEPHARESMSAKYFEQGSVNFGLTVGVRLQYGVTYGVFLEYNGLETPSYISRRRPIIINEYKSTVPVMKSNLTKDFMENIKKGFSKIAKQMR